jgi:hypothetical protein
VNYRGPTVLTGGGQIKRGSPKLTRDACEIGNESSGHFDAVCRIANQIDDWIQHDPVSVIPKGQQRTTWQRLLRDSRCNNHNAQKSGYEPDLQTVAWPLPLCSQPTWRFYAASPCSVTAYKRMIARRGLVRALKLIFPRPLPTQSGRSTVSDRNVYRSLFLQDFLRPGSQNLKQVGGSECKLVVSQTSAFRRKHWESPTCHGRSGMSTPPDALTELMTIVTGYQRSRALMVVAELGIADLLRDGPRSVDELARATHTHSPTLYRVLRALAAVSVLEERPGRMLALTPISEFLRSDAAVPYGHLARLFGRDYQWAAWGALLHSVRTGESAARHVLGVDIWSYRQDHPEENVIFNDAMLAASLSRAAVEAAAYDFGRCTTIADIGGGTGALLATILRMYPNARGILFDQRHVVAEAGPVLDAAGLTSRVTIEGGSFFEMIPAGADAYVMRRILHDWTDEPAIARNSTPALRCPISR